VGRTKHLTDRLHALLGNPASGYTSQPSVFTWPASSGSSDSARGSSWPSPSAAPPRLRQRSD